MLGDDDDSCTVGCREAGERKRHERQSHQKTQRLLRGRSRGSNKDERRWKVVKVKKLTKRAPSRNEDRDPETSGVVGVCAQEEEGEQEETINSTEHTLFHT